jgi:mannan endo-1,6-alpha-mannosidase
MAAAQSCTGGNDGVTCGHKWWFDGWDGEYGVGEQMAALEVVQSNLVERAKGPLSSETGGTSKGDPGAGQGGDEGVQVVPTGVTRADRIGAGILTAILGIATLAAAW